jgi:CheY-like chemotaxis protein
VGTGENVLIVEDEEEWRGIFSRAVKAEASRPKVEIASDRASAEQLIEAAKFAVAIVDIGLDVSDDRNVDGLDVMEKIRATGDETSILVVTGRSGQDALKIARDALKKYGAYDTVGKSSVGPADIRKLLREGFDAYRSALIPRRTDARDAVRGNTAPMSWDDQVTRAISFDGDVTKFYGFLDGLFGEYLPLVPRQSSESMDIEQPTRFVSGEFWSRAIAAAVLICFGAEHTFDSACDAALRDHGIVAADDAGHPVRELSGHGVKGRVFINSERRRHDFAV